MITQAEMNAWLLACKLVLRSHMSNEYAKSYARAGMTVHTEAAIRAQAQYLLGNITGWRDDPSQECRAVLKYLAGVHAKPPFNLDNWRADWRDWNAGFGYSFGQVLRERNKS